jgi:hypothetical protein
VCYNFIDHFIYCKNQTVRNGVWVNKIFSNLACEGVCIQSLDLIVGCSFEENHSDYDDCVNDKLPKFVQVLIKVNISQSILGFSVSFTVVLIHELELA